MENEDCIHWSARSIGFFLSSFKHQLKLLSMNMERSWWSFHSLVREQSRDSLIRVILWCGLTPILHGANLDKSFFYIRLLLLLLLLLNHFHGLNLKWNAASTIEKHIHICAPYQPLCKFTPNIVRFYSHSISVNVFRTRVNLGTVPEGWLPICQLLYSMASRLNSVYSIDWKGGRSNLTT